MVTGSNAAIVDATSRIASCTAPRSAPHTSALDAQHIQVRSWGSSSAGIRHLDAVVPSAADDSAGPWRPLSEVSGASDGEGDDERATVRRTPIAPSTARITARRESIFASHPHTIRRVGDAAVALTTIEYNAGDHLHRWSNQRRRETQVR
jgi:hypothetical protein